MRETEMEKDPVSKHARELIKQKAYVAKSVKNWWILEKGIWGFFKLFLQIFCEFEMISEQSYKKYRGECIFYFHMKMNFVSLIKRRNHPLSGWAPAEPGQSLSECALCLSVLHCQVQQPPRGCCTTSSFLASPSDCPNLSTQVPIWERPWPHTLLCYAALSDSELWNHQQEGQSSRLQSEERRLEQLCVSSTAWPVGSGGGRGGFCWTYLHSFLRTCKKM